VELALDTVLVRGILEEAGDEHAVSKTFFGPLAQDHLLLRQVYNCSDFFFDHDPVYGHNRLPIIPEHFYPAELLYEHPCGFSVGPNVRAVFTRYPVDFAKSLFAPPYAIMGFRIGYQRPPGLSVFIGARNLAGDRYIYSQPACQRAGFRPARLLPRGRAGRLRRGAVGLVRFGGPFFF
jgi:iron complex outermembrane receptor protein